MACRYHYTDEQKAELKQAQRENKNKRIDRRVRALLLRSEGKRGEEIHMATGYNIDYVRRLEKQYIENGITEITGNHYHGNRRNMSFAEEEALLEPFKAQAEKGELVEISAIESAYREAVGHSIGTSQIYYVLHRHGWRKVMPRSKHPKKADDEVIATSKKLTSESAN